MQFEDAIWNAIKEMKKFNYDPKTFKSMIAKHGVLEACKKLILDNKISDGLVNLVMHDKIDLSIEAIAIRPEWSHLFDEVELNACRRKLKSYNYKYDENTPNVQKEIDLKKCVEIFVLLNNGQVKFDEKSITKKMFSDCGLNTGEIDRIKEKFAQINKVFELLGLKSNCNVDANNNIDGNEYGSILNYLEDYLKQPENIVSVESKCISVNDANIIKSSQAPIGFEKPIKYTATISSYLRSPAVRMYVLARANGVCELCGKSPFLTAEGSIFLEVHHLVPISIGGADSVENAAGICPNCHRELHFGVDKEIKSKQLMKKIAT